MFEKQKSTSLEDACQTGLFMLFRMFGCFGQLTPISESGENTFVECLNDNCPFTVTFALGHENLLECSGQVLVAPPGRHMIVNRHYITILDTPPANFYRPSVDELFFSLARDRSVKPVGVLLTGMGSDGAKGLKAIRETGGLTICQDETTSIVFGMPKAAIEINGYNCTLG